MSTIIVERCSFYINTHTLRDNSFYLLRLLYYYYYYHHPRIHAGLISLLPGRSSFSTSSNSANFDPSPSPSRPPPVFAKDLAFALAAPLEAEAAG